MASERDINLIPVEQRASERFELLTKKLSLLSVILLVATAIFTLATLFFFTALVSKRSALISEIEQSSSTINSYKASEELATVIKNKASAADKILLSRADYTELFEQFAQLVPQGVYFSDIKISSGKMIVSGKAKTSADIAGFTSALVSAEGSKIISSVSVESLSSDEGGVYSFVVSGKLIKS